MLCKDFAYPGLMRFFEEISAIPRPSFHEEKIADYLCDFAAERGLEFYRDSIHNVLIKMKGSAGRENEPAILLQGHSDMVCEKNEDTEHDFMRDGLKLYVENGSLRAKGTTLGADNGDAVAVMLYVLDGAESNLPSHPPIECLFTVSEEVGLEGANSFDYSKISARRMINMDSADEKLIIAGCAGGQRSNIIYNPNVEKPCGESIRISIKGLAGGHSGEDIEKGRANANKLMGRVLLALSRKYDIRIASLTGGSKDNAIPREAQAVISSNDADSVINEVSAMADIISRELGYDDADFSMTAKRVASVDKVMDKSSGDKILFLMATAQNGIFEMNKSICGLVEFSRNFGVMESSEDLSEVKLTFHTRSPRNSQIEYSVHQLEAYAELLGARVEHGAWYPGWEYAEVSPLRDAYAECYNELFGEDIKITTIHAGLECGIIKERVPDMDIISCGPIVLDLHSPEESMDIASFERFFTIIKNVLAK